MEFKHISVPDAGEKLDYRSEQLIVPDNPILLFIEGDGAGRDIWKVSVRVFDAAVDQAYHGKRAVHWTEAPAGKKAFDLTGSWLPDETVEAFGEFQVGIIGSLTMPVGDGVHSLSAALREALDLYVYQRPVRYFPGIPSPVKHPERVDMVVFRETTEDIYAGIEWRNGTVENLRFKDLLAENFPDEFSKIRFPNSSGIGIKPVSEEGSKRLVRAAIRWALDNKRRSVTLVHKGNIQKFTEGAFRKWGYEVAEQEFGDDTYTWAQWDRTKADSGEASANAEQKAALEGGKLLVKDVIADIVFQQTITRAREFDVLATMSLNGDYLSDALAAQVGGIGIAPGGNINYTSGHAVFEGAHDTAPGSAGQDQANPGSMILSGEMMFRHMGWHEAADLIIKGMQGAIAARTVTQDLSRLMDGATELKCSEFGDAVIAHMAE